VPETSSWAMLDLIVEFLQGQRPPRDLWRNIDFT